jgi:hypothetical protein
VTCLLSKHLTLLGLLSKHLRLSSLLSKHLRLLGLFKGLRLCKHLKNDALCWACLST